MDMTLEEKIREWALRAASVNCGSAYRAGANRMLSELLPVMEEMHDVLLKVRSGFYPDKIIQRESMEALEKYKTLFP